MNERLGQQILLCSPALHEQEYAACTDLLVDGGSSDVHVVFVSYAASPDEIRDRWQKHVGAMPARFGMITLGQFARTPNPAHFSSNNSSQAVTSTARFETVQPTNLTELGVRVSELLDEWGNRDASLTLCFDSITALAQHVSRAGLLRFLRAVGQHTKTAEATAHFHLNPDAVSDETVAAVKSAMDRVIDCRDEPPIDG